MTSKPLKGQFNYTSVLAVLLGGILSGCGVKGNPQAPANPPFLGHGDIGLPKKGKSPKKNNKYDYNKDFDESGQTDQDFQ